MGAGEQQIPHVSRFSKIIEKFSSLFNTSHYFDPKPKDGRSAGELYDTELSMITKIKDLFSSTPSKKNYM